MSTAVIVVVVVVVVVLAVLAFALPRARARAQVRARERELGQRRDRAASTHRDAAEQRAQEADAAERRARIAEQEAARQRADAQIHEERAGLHEQGLADDELVADDERERFAGTSAFENAERGDHGPIDEPARVETSRVAADDDQRRGASRVAADDDQRIDA